MPIFPSIEKLYAAKNRGEHHGQQAKHLMLSKTHFPLHVNRCMLQNLSRI